jgi:plastocyanin
MSPPEGTTPPTRRERRAAEREVLKASEYKAKSALRTGSAGSRRLRAAVFGILAVAVLGVGVTLAAGDLLGQRGTTTVAAAIPVRMSMAGFDPPVIPAKAGQTVTIDFWTTDAAPHLQNGVHTFISDELKIYEEVPAESRRTFTLTAPAKPGDYDIYCDTCCGGKDSPTMHGTIRVEA